MSRRLNPKALSDPSSVIPQGEPFPIHETDLGFDTGDKDVNEAAKILRLLHIQVTFTFSKKISCYTFIHTLPCTKHLSCFYAPYCTIVAIKVAV